MSLRYEQYNALKLSKEFLTVLLRHPKKEIRDKAYNCLRHFPRLEESGKPQFSKDEFTPDKV